MNQPKKPAKSQDSEETPRQGAAPDAPINGYSMGFIDEKVKKLFSGDTTVFKAQNNTMQETLVLRSLQILAAKLARLEKELGL